MSLRKSVAIMKELHVLGDRWSLAACGLLVVALAGCGGSSPKLYPATGTVTFEGNPVDGAQVTYIPQQGVPSLGTTDSAGKYAMATRGKPGVPAGTYSITVTKISGSTATEGSQGPTALTDAQGQPNEEMLRQMNESMSNIGGQMQEAVKNAKEQKSLLPHKYSLPDGSGLSAIVTTDPSKNVFDLPLVP